MPMLIDLLEKGYFPRELPPPFNTLTYAKFAKAAGSSWTTNKWTKCVAHNLARPGGLRRPLKIPNPVSYFGLASILSNNWIVLRRHTWKKRLSASRPYRMKNSTRAIVPRYKYGELPRLRALRRRGMRYLLSTDINQFYPTLYTHTVPWALHTKAVCKQALKKKGKEKNLVGDFIDGALRSMNDGQTHGIPIGPDTSLLIAEVLLSAVDGELINRCKNLVRGFRYVDDYDLSFSKLSDLESVLNELQSILSDFDLSLNSRKTRIQDLPCPLEDTWSINLRKFAIEESIHYVTQRNDFLSLFSQAFEIHSSRPEESVLRYAIARVQNENVHGKAWRTFQNCVLGAVGADPSTLSAALGTLYKVATNGSHTVAIAPLQETLENIIIRHANRGEGSEVAWALWAALAWSVPLGTDSARSVSSMADDVVALLALDANAQGLFPQGSLDQTAWADILSQSDVLVSEHWLLAYEADLKKWLPCRAVSQDQVFKSMNRAGVSFYDRGKNIPQYPAAAQGMPGGSVTESYA